jgi:hypothetical protein
MFHTFFKRDLYRPWPESTAELYKLSDYSRNTSSNASEARRLWADRHKGYQKKRHHDDDQQCL